MVKRVFRKNKRGLGFFVLLDLWSIIAVVAFLVLLLIYITFINKVTEVDIGNKLRGSNFPHYIISDFNGHERIFDGCAGAPEDITMTEFLIWLDANKQEMTDDPDGEFANCEQSLLIALNQYYSPYFKKDYGGDYDFSIELQGEELLEQCYIDDPWGLESIFSYELPGKEKNIKITICFTPTIKGGFW